MIKAAWPSHPSEKLHHILHLKCISNQISRQRHGTGNYNVNINYNCCTTIYLHSATVTPAIPTSSVTLFRSEEIASSTFITLKFGFGLCTVSFSMTYPCQSDLSELVISSNCPQQPICLLSASMYHLATVHVSDLGLCDQLCAYRTCAHVMLPHNTRGNQKVLQLHTLRNNNNNNDNNDRLTAFDPGQPG